MLQLTAWVATIGAIACLAIARGYEASKRGRFPERDVVIATFYVVGALLTLLAFDIFR